MANETNKGLSVVAGAGSAMGFTSGRIDDPANSDPIAAVALNELDDEFLNLDPLLDRLERMEARIESILQMPAAVLPDERDHAALFAELERRVDEGARELAALRERIEETERRAAESLTSVRRKVEDSRSEVPAQVENSVAARIGELRHNLGVDIERTHERTLDAFEKVIEEKISTRTGTIDQELADQSGAIDGLRMRASETDHNLQRLVSAIEKLCERVQVISSVSESQQSAQYGRPPIQRRPEIESRFPFESQLEDALEREPVVPTLRTEEPVVKVQVPGSSASGGKGSNALVQKTSRFLFRNMAVAGFTLLASTRLLR